MGEFHYLSNIKPGQGARIRELTTNGSTRRRLLDIGPVEGIEVECLGKSPLGDPCTYLIRGTVTTIRPEDCRDILIHE